MEEKRGVVCGAIGEDVKKVNVLVGCSLCLTERKEVTKLNAIWQKTASMRILKKSTIVALLGGLDGLNYEEWSQCCLIVFRCV